MKLLQLFFRNNTLSESERFVPPWTSDGEVSLPKHLLLAVTFRCMAKCPHCYLLQQDDATFREQPLMQEDLFEMLLSAPFCRDIKKVTFTGGEPLLHPQLPEWVQHVKNAGIATVATITNGMSLQNDKTFERLFALKDLNYINVSLDACNAQEYCEAKGIKHCDFDLICSRIRELSKHAKAMRTRLSGSFVMREFSASRVRHVVQFAEALGFHKINLHALHLVDPAQDGSNPAVSSMAECQRITDCRDYATDLTVKVPVQLADRSYFCPSIARYLCVGATGELAPCCHIPWNSRYGEIPTSLENPINHKNIASMRSAFAAAAESRNENLLPVECRECPKRTVGHLHYSATKKEWHRA